MAIVQDRCGFLEGKREAFERLGRGDARDGYDVFDLDMQWKYLASFEIHLVAIDRGLLVL